jgi:hypothetical protein
MPDPTPEEANTLLQRYVSLYERIETRTSPDGPLLWLAIGTKSLDRRFYLWYRRMNPRATPYSAAPICGSPG